MWLLKKSFVLDVNTNIGMEEKVPVLVKKQSQGWILDLMLFNSGFFLWLVLFFSMVLLLLSLRFGFTTVHSHVRILMTMQIFYQ